MASAAFSAAFSARCSTRTFKTPCTQAVVHARVETPNSPAFPFQCAKTLMQRPFGDPMRRLQREAAAPQGGTAASRAGGRTSSAIMTMLSPRRTMRPTGTSANLSAWKKRSVDSFSTTLPNWSNVLPARTDHRHAEPRPWANAHISVPTNAFPSRKVTMTFVSSSDTSEERTACSKNSSDITQDADAALARLQIQSTLLNMLISSG